MQALLEDGAVLDRYYIPTRYPNSLPDLTPGQCYFKKDADLCLDSAQRILSAVQKEFEKRTPDFDVPEPGTEVEK